MDDKKELKVLGQCPFCNEDMVHTTTDKFNGFTHKTYHKEGECKFFMWGEVFHHEITDSMATELLTKGETICEFNKKDKSGTYKRKLVLNKDTQKIELGDFVND